MSYCGATQLAITYDLAQRKSGLKGSEDRGLPITGYSLTTGTLNPPSEGNTSDILTGHNTTPRLLCTLASQVFMLFVSIM